MLERSKKDSEELALFIKRKDSPPPWAFFPISAFYCDKGLLSFAVQSVVDLYVRLRHGANSATAKKLALSCVVRKVSGLLVAGSREDLGQAQKVLREAQRNFPEELRAPLYSLEGKLLLFHQHPPAPQPALRAYEQAMEGLSASPYCTVLSQPHLLLFGAAMAAMLMAKCQKAMQYYKEYEAFVAKQPKKRWGPEIELDLKNRIEAMCLGRKR